MEVDGKTPLVFSHPRVRAAHLHNTDQGVKMPEDNKRNLLFFEAPTMRALYTEMDEWQAKHRKRLQSVSIQPDGDGFAAIALSNPTEVIIVNGYGKGGAAVGGNVLATSGSVWLTGKVKKKDQSNNPNT